MAMQLGELEYLISVNGSKVDSGINSAEKKVKSFGDRLSSWAVAKGQIIGKMAEKAAVATASFVKSSVSESMNFDSSMAQVAATLGKSVKEIQQLNDFAREMGSKTAFSATEAAQGLNYMALAGYDTEKSMKMLPQVMNLAAAGNFDLARASDMVTDAQSALGLSIEETEVMVDQMAKTASKTNTSVEQLGDAFLTVGGTAKNLKGGTEELSAVLGVLADNGIKGSEGGTALRNVLMRLTAPTDKASKELKKLGVEAFDADGNLRALPEVFQDFNKAMSGKTMQERSEIFSEIFNVRDLKSVEALLGTSAQRWKELSIEIGNANGAAEKMAETQLDNLAGDVTIFKSALSETRLTITEKLTPSLRKFVQIGTNLLNRFTTAYKEKGLKGVAEETKNVFVIFRKSIAQWLNMDDVNNATWIKIGGQIIKKIGNKIKGKAIKMLFGENYQGDVNLSTIAAKIGEKFKSGLSKVKVGLAGMLGIDDLDNVSWSDIASKIREKLTLALKASKIAIAQFIGLEDATNANWADIGKGIYQNLKDKVKLRLAEWVDAKADGEGNYSWASIAEGFTNKVKEQAEKYKIKIAEWVDAESDGQGNYSWASIAQGISNKIKAKAEHYKIKIAEWVDAEADGKGNYSWASIAQGISDKIKAKAESYKIKIAEWVDAESDGQGNYSWASIAQGISNKIKVKAEAYKIKIAEWVDAESDGDGNYSWSSIAEGITNKIKAKANSYKIKIAEWLDAESDGQGNYSWSSIAKGITNKIKGKSDAYKIKVAEWLDVESDGDVKWSDIWGGIKAKITEAAKTAKLKLADILNIEANENGEISWVSIGKKIAEGIGSGIKKGKHFILEMILGEGLEEDQYTFANAGKKIAEWLGQSVADGGFFDTLLANFSDKVEGIINFVSGIIRSIANWIEQNPGKITSILDSVVSAINKALPAILNAIKPILSSIVGALVEILQANPVIAAVISALLYKKVTTTVTGQKVYWSTPMPVWVVNQTGFGNPTTSPVTAPVTSPVSQLAPGLLTSVLTAGAATGLIGSLFGSKTPREIPITIPTNDVEIADDPPLEVTADVDGNTEPLNDTLKQLHPEVPVKLVPKVSVGGGLNALGFGGGITLGYGFTRAFAPSSKGMFNMFGGLADARIHAKGAWNIPFDNYPALLHRDEMVLTSSRARKYREGEESMDYSAIGEMIGDAVQTAIGKMYVMMSGEKVADLTTKRVKKNINAMTYSRLKAMGG